ncbi:2OG-Fe(II) oxygenase [Chitinimonas taiwanensis]|uniref:2OG-Fe(II) oxygenase n=1 Tax=Chitinimonas taiwanensis TaxID=240412 RepID=UPI0015873246|nr:2OG-Fe(II) oxygenase [Chitinimonas taiwanensis]
MIARSEARGYANAATDYPPSYRNNDRQVLDDLNLAAQMTERLRPYAPANLADQAGNWQLEHVNERFRFCRYQPGQQFNLHQDGVHHRDAARRSRLTFMIYLTDGDAFAGGDTVFYSAGPGGDANGQDAKEIGRVKPRAGSLILFDHGIWHAGEQVSGGIKHVMRSDVIYRQTANDKGEVQRAQSAGHDGYIWTLAALDHGQYASGGRDAIIRIWDRHGSAIQQLHGHDQSVLGLAALPGRRLASVSRDRSLRLWNWADGNCEKSIVAHDAAVLDVTRLSDGRLLTCSADALIKVWDEQGLPLACLEGHCGWVWQMAAMGQLHWASASEDGCVRIWNGATLECSAVLEGNVPLRTLLAVEQAIWTGDIEGGIACWCEKDGNWSMVWRFLAHNAAVRRLSLLDAKHVASCGEDNQLRIWRCTGPEQVFMARHENFVTDALPIAGGIVSASYDGCLQLHTYSINEGGQA